MKSKVAADGGGVDATAKVYKGITMKELLYKWTEFVHFMEQENRKITNADHALEGALTIRYAMPADVVRARKTA